MALDVGVVAIDYSLSPPSGLVEDFARDLKAYDEFHSWRVSANGHVFLDIDHDAMISHAHSHIRAKGLTPTERQQIMEWIESLPWRDNPLTLHFGW